MKNSKYLFKQLIILCMIFLFSANLHAENTTKKHTEALKKHVKYLASEELEGRGTGMEGNNKAAKYIAKYFKKNGVKPLADNYFQKFEVTTGVTLADGNTAKISQSKKNSEWIVETDFMPLTFTENTTVEADLIFAGYGISAPDKNFDDYANLNVKDKIVIVFRSSPDHDNPHGELSEFASLNYKVRNARDQGAKGIIVVSPSQMTDDLLALKLSISKNSAGIVAVHVKRSVIDRLMPKGKSLADLENQIKADRKSHSFALENTSAKIKTAINFVVEETNNVIGYVPGTDEKLAGEYLLVGAHFDHLGWGDRGGTRYFGTEKKIHYGADDNASGTSTMLEAAKFFVNNPQPRSLIFMGFSGEEMGLLGSVYFSQNPTVSLDNIITMVNMDMVGRVIDNKLNVTGTGTAPQWNDMLDKLAQKHGLTISKTADGFGSSDHATFYAKDIPVINLFTGLHDDYHMPSDTWDKINYEGLTSVLYFAGDIIQQVANFEKRPEFVKVKVDDRKGQRMTFKVSVGTIPDYSDHPKGMRITGVKKDSPADKGGMMGGDVIIKFGDEPIKNIYDFTYSLGKFNPGQVVIVKVLRDVEGTEKEVDLEITLAARK